MGRGVQDDAIAEPQASQHFRAVLQPPIAGVGEQSRRLLVERNAARADGRRPAIDEAQHVGYREAVEARDEIDVEQLVREPFGLRDRAIAKKIGVRKKPLGRDRPAGELAVEEREFRVHAGDRPRPARCPGNPQGHVLCQHDIEDAILRAVAAQPCRDRRFNLPVVLHSGDLFDRIDGERQDVLGRDRAAVSVPGADFSGRRAAAVDDEQNILSRLRGGRPGAETHRHGDRGEKRARGPECTTSRRTARARAASIGGRWPSLRHGADGRLTPRENHEGHEYPERRCRPSTRRGWHSWSGRSQGLRQSS